MSKTKSNSISKDFPLYHSDLIPIFTTQKIIPKGKKIIFANVYTNEHPDFLKLDCMKEKGAVSPESAIDLTAYGLKNPRMMNTLIHSKHVGVTEDGSFWLMKEVLTVPDITYEVDDGNKELEIEIIMS